MFDFFDRHSKQDFEENTRDYLVQNTENEPRSASFSVGRTADNRVQIIMQSESRKATLTMCESETDLLIRLLTAAKSNES